MTAVTLGLPTRVLFCGPLYVNPGTTFLFSILNLSIREPFP